MKINMGQKDRMIRSFVIAPLAIVLAFVVGAGTIGGIALFVVAGIMLATSAVRSCPIYTVAGLDTTGTQPSKG